MNPFKPDIASYIVSLDPSANQTSWGVILEKRNVGFVFYEINSANKALEKLPADLHLIHIWEDQWITKRDVVKSRLNSLFGQSERVFARTTKVVKLTKAEVIDFLEVNHLNEPISAKYKYGLIIGEELVSVAVFSSSCPVHRNEKVYKSHQLVRFCTKNGISVVGGLSKLISYFIKAHQPEDIMSYADLDWSNGKSYQKLGFEKIGTLPPQPFFLDSGSMQRFYKINKPANADNLMQFYNQGSAKYVLDLKNGTNE